jgi:hypothetical protein
MSNEERRSEPQGENFVFPKWQNKVPLLVIGVIGPVLTIGLIAAVWYYFSPQNTDVGYQPHQPVPYSHKLHVGEMGMDCRYCHTGVEQTPQARVPPTQTCMNCHTSIKTDSANLLKIRESWETGQPVEWVRVHKTPDYAYFDHSAHVGAGVGCESCHGRVDQMVEVRQMKTLSMGFCVDCHRAPEQHLRPTSEVTTMGYKPEGDQLAIGTKLKADKNINPPIHCSGCHR